MTIKPPAWCSRAVPVPHGWKHWATSEILLPKMFTQEQIAEFWAEKEGVTAPVAPAPVPEPVVVEEASEVHDLESLSKRQLEELGREHGVELDRRQSKSSLVSQMKDIITSK